MRLRGYDYSDPGPYSVTVCTFRRRLFLGRIEGDRMHTSRAGELVNLVWRSLPSRFRQLDLGTFQVMPNHFHAIIEIRRVPEVPRVTLGQVVGAFKSEVTARYCKGVRRAGWPRLQGLFWQRGFYDRIIRDDREHQRTAEYIRANPRRWQADRLNPSRKR